MMSETVYQTVSLVGQVIEDVSYEALRPHVFEAALVGVKKSPQYKPDGFFVFSDLSPGQYTLRIVGERFQTQQYIVTVPLEPPMFDSPPIFDPLPIFNPPGDNELVVVAKTVNGGSQRITFDSVTLRKEIRAGAQVLASGFAAQLAVPLDIGEVKGANLNTVTGLTAGSIVRIIRDKSIRLKFDPYYLFPSALTHIIGKVVLQDAPTIPLEGAQVRLTEVQGVSVVLHDAAGANIATVGVDETHLVLGTEKDIVTFTNQHSDYNLYFQPGQLGGDVTLEASFPGYPAQTTTIAITDKVRNRADFELFRP